MKITTLLTDGDQLQVTLHANEAEALAALRANFAQDYTGPEDELTQYVCDSGVVVHIDEHEVPVNVQIIHGRHPDLGCEHTVFVNDEHDRDAEVEDIDPGRGYARADWNERIAEQAEDTTNFGKAVLVELQSASGSPYIEDES